MLSLTRVASKRLWFVVVLCSSICAHRAFAGCACNIPAPCASKGHCLLPLVDKIDECPKGTQDCRTSAGQQLCDLHIKSEDGFCCWTACSSINAFRRCFDPPHGFDFDETGKRDGRECHDPLNVREQCCLRQLKTMRGVKPKSGECPKLAPALKELFKTVDGNGPNAANLEISAAEALLSLQWLKAHGYLFVAQNFTEIDADKSQKVSWYEIELFCGLTGTRLSSTSLSKMRKAELTAILSNPLMLAAVMSCVIIGELVGVIQAICTQLYEHCIHGSAEQPEAATDHSSSLKNKQDACWLKIIHLVLSQIWPLFYTAAQWLYFLLKIDWEVCDGFADLKFRYLVYLGLYTGMKIIGFGLWVSRKMPVSPSIDIERRQFLFYAFIHKNCKWLKYVLLGILPVACGYMFTRGVFYGSVGFYGHDESLHRCMHEEPDIKLLYDVNEKYFIWNVFQISVLNFYVLFTGSLQLVTRNNVQLKKGYAALNAKSATSEDLSAVVNRAYQEWQWLQ